MAYEINCTPVECVKLRKNHSPDELAWAAETMAFYGCRPMKGDGDNLCEFVADVFAAGRISGVREERKRRRRGGSRSSIKADIVKCLDRISDEDARLVVAAVYECLAQ